MAKPNESTEAAAIPPAEAPPIKKPALGFWGEAWKRLRRNHLAMAGLWFIGILAFFALFSPAIVGTKPIVCYYKGWVYFPAMAYFNLEWENPIFYKDQFGYDYPTKLRENDPNSLAVWPLVYQDPERRVPEDEWPGRRGNPRRASPPSWLNLFGTNQEGVDVFAQVVHGAKVALLVGFVSTGIAALFGILIGALAGYFGGWVDILLSRLIEVMMSIPTLILILALLAILEKATIWHVMAVLGLTGWTRIARLTRAEFMKLKESEYVSAARALGAGHIRVMFRHILPNALAPALVPIVFGIATAVLIESGLSYLGFGPADTVTWGKLLTAGRRSELVAWWLILFPGMAIFLTVLAYNLIGEGLQEATDPRLREAGK